MPTPTAIRGATTACRDYVRDLRAAQAEYRKRHRLRKFWRGSTRDHLDHSRVRKIAEEPTGEMDPDTGVALMRSVYRPGKTMRQMRGTARPPTGFHADVSEYVGPQGKGWFVTFTHKASGYQRTFDGDGPETHRHGWRAPEVL